MNTSEDGTFGWSGEWDREYASDTFSVGVFPIVLGKRRPAWVRVGGPNHEPYWGRVHEAATDIAEIFSGGPWLRKIFAKHLPAGVSVRVTKAGRAAGVEVIR